jgi:FMN phosphatase YigB (HAD superfamily)
MSISLVTKAALIPKNTKSIKTKSIKATNNVKSVTNATKKQRYKTALVFDIDGVIVRNKILLSNVGANCSNFIRLIDKNNLTEIDADTYNNKLYKDYGHSLKGWLHENNKYNIISHRRYIDNYFMRQLFNRYVYDENLLNDLRSYLYTDTFTKNEDYTYLLLIQNMCINNNLPVYLYSNAPMSWCSLVANKMKINNNNVYSSDHKLLSKQLLYKPDIRSYNKVATDILKNNEEVKNIIFIDDTLDNLVPLSSSNNKLQHDIWVPILFNPSNYSIDSTFISVSSMKKLYLLLDVLLGLQVVKR